MSLNRKFATEGLVWTREEAAAQLGISVRKLQELTQTRKVPHLRLGRRVVYPRLALAKYVADRTCGG